MQAIGILLEGGSLNASQESYGRDFSGAVVLQGQRFDGRHIARIFRPGEAQCEKRVALGGKAEILSGINLQHAVCDTAAAVSRSLRRGTFAIVRPGGGIV